MKTKDEFELFCNNQLSYLLEEYYKKNKKQIFFWIFLFVFFECALFFIIPQAVQTLAISISNKVIMVGMTLVNLIMCTLIAMKNISNNMYQVNKRIIEETMKFISNSKDEVVLGEKKRISVESLKECRIFNLDDLKVSGKNYINTKYDGKNLTISDCAIYKRIKKEKGYVDKYIFDGQFISMTFNKPIRSFIYLVPNNLKDFGNKLLNYINFDGTKIDLENIQFNKKYKVYSYDEIQARYVLSLRLMERMNDLEYIFKNKKYIVFRENGRLTLFIEHESMESVRKVKLPILKNTIKEQKSFLNIFKRLIRYFEIYDTLDLSNRLYKPNELAQKLAEKEKEVEPKQRNKNIIIPTNVNATSIENVNESQIKVGTESGLIENKSYGYQYRYKDCIGLNKDRKLLLSHDVENTVTIVQPDELNKEANLIDNKINMMVNEFGWIIKEERKYVIFGKNKFIKVVYAGDSPNSKLLTSYYFYDDNLTDVTFSINFKYFGDSIEKVNEQVEYILTNFMIKETQGGVIKNEEKGYEYNYKNAIERDKEKILLKNNTSIEIRTFSNREKLDKNKFLQQRKDKLINELKWKEVKFDSEFVINNKTFFKYVAYTSKEKLHMFLYIEEEFPEVWYQFVVRTPININISDMDEITYSLSTFKHITTQKSGKVFSEKYGFEYKYINVNSIKDDRQIVLKNDIKAYIQIHNVKNNNELDSYIRKYINLYVEKYSWIKKEEINECIFKENRYKKFKYTSSTNLGYNMDLYIIICPNTNRLASFLVKYYNDEILNVQTELEEILSTFNMFELKSGIRTLEKDGYEFEYINALGVEENEVIYSTDDLIRVSTNNIDYYKDENEFFEKRLKTIQENGWNKLSHESISINDITTAVVVSFENKENHISKMKKYFYKLPNDEKKIYEVSLYYEKEDNYYNDEIMKVLETLHIIEKKEGIIKSLEKGYTYNYKNALLDKENNILKYDGNTSVKMVIDKSTKYISEEEFLNDKLYEMTAKHGWIFKNMTKEKYGENEYLKYTFDYKEEEHLEKYILLPIVSDKKSVYQINFTYYKENILNIVEEKNLILSSFKLIDKINGTHSSEKFLYTFDFINANCVNKDGYVVYPNNFKIKVFVDKKQEYSSFEEYCSSKIKKWVNEWAYVLTNKGENILINQNSFIKYKVRSQKSNFEREVYFYNDDTSKNYYQITFEYYDDDINYYSNEVQQILKTFKTL